tara:strand:- start:488 stop:751 length:264 start_codon:yes stop_codon:yes gene_type:complete
MKIKLFQRQVYHKVGMIEISVPNFIDPEDVDKWLRINEHLWVDKLAENMDECSLTHGLGMDSLMHWTDRTEEAEYFYKLPDGNGGHI